MQAYIINTANDSSLALQSPQPCSPYCFTTFRAGFQSKTEHGRPTLGRSGKEHPQYHSCIGSLIIHDLDGRLIINNSHTKRYGLSTPTSKPSVSRSAPSQPTSVKTAIPTTPCPSSRILTQTRSYRTRTISLCIWTRHTLNVRSCLKGQLGSSLAFKDFYGRSSRR
jgi:hypothetical protein